MLPVFTVLVIAIYCCYATQRKRQRTEPHQHEWISTILNRHEMAEIMIKHSKHLPLYYQRSIHNLTRALYLYPVLVNTRPVGLISKYDICDPLKLTAYLLRLMRTWNEATKPIEGRYENINFHTNNLLRHIEHYLLLRPKQLTYHRMDAVYEALEYLFIDEEKALFFWDKLYFQPYTHWMSNGELQFVNVIGNGAQAVVIKVQSRLDTDTVYALKIFTDTMYQCLSEEAIMHRIMTEIMDIDDIRIPRIFGKHCNDTKSILMQFINGYNVKNKQSWTPHKTLRILSQISDIVVRLSRIGIGHFDINSGNIIRDAMGNYWLIDFGLGFSIRYEDKANTIRDVSLPIIGTFIFMAPQTIRLNLAMTDISIKAENSDYYDMNISNMIIEGNLYMLQAMSLYFLYNDENETKQKLKRIANGIENCWEQYEHLYCSQMRCYFENMWQLNKYRLNEYFQHQSTPNMIIKRDMFWLLDENYSFTSISKPIQNNNKVIIKRPTPKPLPSNCGTTCIAM